MNESMMIDLAAAICERLESNFIVHPTITLADAAKALDISEDKMRQLCKKGEIPYIRMDKQYKIRPRDINRYLEQNYHKGGEDARR